MSEQNERLELLGALLVKSVNLAGSLPEPLRSLISAASAAMTDEQREAQYNLFEESGLGGFTFDLYEDSDLVKAMQTLRRALAGVEDGPETAPDAAADDEPPSPTPDTEESAS